MNTEIVKVSDATCREDIDTLRRGAEIIKNGGLVVFPTETVYGLGADGTNAEAAAKIYAAKGRPSDNPLIIHISRPEDAEEYAVTNELYYKLAEMFMPGPITVIRKSRDTVPKATRGGLDTVAIRCPINPIANKLIELAGVPIAAPSANISGSPSPTSARHVINDLSGKVDMIIDGGECDFGLESTIVSITDGEGLKLLRPGKITVDELRVLCDVEIAGAVTEELKANERPLSPGMKYRHYAPASPLVLLDGSIEDVLNYIDNNRQNGVAVICYNEDVEAFETLGTDISLYKLGARGDLMEQAHQLFAILRDVDTHNHSIIYAPLPSKEGIGLAIYNRLIRASAHTILKIRR